jgi:hypothetical protein
VNGYAVVSVVALGLAGCSGNPHLTREHGRSYRAFLERQAFHRAAATPPYQEAEKGLDAQEAAIVARSYRQGLAPKDARQGEEPQVLLVEQPTGHSGRPPLAPSVPKD